MSALVKCTGLCPASPWRPQWRWSSSTRVSNRRQTWLTCVLFSSVKVFTHQQVLFDLKIALKYLSYRLTRVKDYWKVHLITFCYIHVCFVHRGRYLTGGGSGGAADVEGWWSASPAEGSNREPNSSGSPAPGAGCGEHCDILLGPGWCLGGGVPVGKTTEICGAPGVGRLSCGMGGNGLIKRIVHPKFNFLIICGTYISKVLCALKKSSWFS